MTKQSEPIAIVGMACRLPGEVNNTKDFWDLLINSRSGFTEMPKDRMNMEAWYHPEGVRPGGIVSKAGYFCKHDLNEFDNSFFNISAVEASTLDPAQKQLLEVSYEAFESAGLSLEDIKGSSTGVYVGNFGLDEALKVMRDSEYLSTYTSTGTGGTILSNRISYIFDLQGPSFTLDTACSSSQYALHLACVGLQNGDCKAALIAAPNAIRSVEAHLMSSRLGAISPTSKCHTFDVKADGYSRADGFGAIYITKLSTALQRRLPVRAVIRGTAIGANGHGVGLTHPDGVGQARVIRKSYADAGIKDLSQTAYFECHGTGTPVGDPIETKSVSSVFAEYRTSNDPLLIGSVKTNLGHGEAAAGITAVIKMALAIEKEIIPATIGVETVNPAIKLDEWKLKIVTEPTKWPSNIPIRRASVNSFGYGGANAHVILEGLDSVLSEFKAFPERRLLTLDLQDMKSSSSSDEEDVSEQSTPPTSNAPSTSEDVFKKELPKVIMCSAKSEQSLEMLVETTKEVLKSNLTSDVAFTLNRRSKFDTRATAIVREGQEPEFTAGKISKDRKLGFIFTGQGAQWPQMGKDLMDFAPFRASIFSIDEALKQLPSAPSWTVEEMIEKDMTAAEMDEPRMAQMMSVAIEIALVDLLVDWNLLPELVAGHSSGEIAAAYCAGFLTRSEAVAVAFYRGHATSEAEKGLGGMLAVGVAPDEAIGLLPANGKVVVGCVNSPRSVTLSGDAQELASIKETLDDRKIFNRLVATKGIAYHSKYMKNAADAYDGSLQGIRSAELTRDIRAQLFSTVTGSLWTEKEIPMSYWRQNMENTVLFYQAVSEMRRAGMSHAIEIGPHSTLRSPILDIVKALEVEIPSAFQYLGAMKRKDDCVGSILTVCAELSIAGFNIDLDHVNGSEGAFILDFPAYKWDHSMKFVLENRTDKEWRLRKFLRHDLIGSQIPGSALNVTVFRNVLSMNTVPWIADHKVGASYVFPAAGHMSLAIEALKQVRTHNSEQPAIFVLEDAHFGSAMIVDEPIEVFITMKKQHLGSATVSNIWWEFEISSVKEGISTEHAKGRISSQVEAPHHGNAVLPESILANRERIAEAYWYNELTKTKGLIFGRSFQRNSEIYLDAVENRAKARMNTSVSSEITGMTYESEYVVHPTILDSCLQLSVLAASRASHNQAYVPFSVNRLSIFENRTGKFASSLTNSIEASGRIVGFKGLYGNCELRNPETNDLMVSFDGLRFIGLPAMESPTKREVMWRLVWDDDYNAINKENEEVYFPQGKFMPKQYSYSRERRVRFVRMAIQQFAQKHPDLLSIESQNTEITHFLEWVRWLLEKVQQENIDIYEMSIEDRDSEIAKERVLMPSGLDWTYTLYKNLHKVISGKISVFDIGSDENQLIGKFYATQLIYDKFARVVELLGYKHPDMKILEIGAGTGSATEYALNSLTSGETKRYDKYFYTDITPSFFTYANERFAQFEDIEYQVYDMEKSPEEQGYEPESFDLIIASCTVHVTANITNTLKSIRKLLKVGGRLLLSEITAEWDDQTFNMGLLPGFYKGHEEGRTRHPFYTTEQWDEALSIAGFQTELSVNDIPRDHGFTVISASAIAFTTPMEEKQRENVVTIVHLSNHTPVFSHLETLGKAKGLSIQQRALVQDDKINSPEWVGSKRIIVLAELERYIWPSIAHKEWVEFQKMLQRAESVLWVTQGGLLAGEDAEANLVNGFLQCLELNPNMLVASMDFEKTTPRNEEMARDILFREDLLPLEVDKQFRQHQKRWLVSRLLPDQRLITNYNKAKLIDQTTVDTPLKELGPVQISTTDPGRLSSLIFRPDHEIIQTRLKPEEVQIDVKAVGMNMVELSALTGGYDTNDLSSEFSGIVTQIGSNVTDLEVGNRVFAMYAGKFGNVARAPAKACHKARGNESFEELATLPSAYCTAFYAIVTVGRVQPGETVFIQSATGGFGMAALAIARLQQATVFASAGSESKRELLRNFGIPAENIFDSRNNFGAADLKAATGGRGFDLVLNTSSGDYFRNVSWQLVAPFGRFIELKKNDILDKGTINLQNFNEGASFIPVDMHYICHHRQDILGSLIKAVGKMYHSHQIHPLPVLKYPISAIAEAYQEFSRFQHTGKLVLSYDEEALMPYVDEPPRVKFSTEAAYLIVGGLRGVGSFLGQWMVRHGAKHLVLLARSSIEGDAKDTVDRLQQMGATVYTVQGDVAHRPDVRRAFTVSGLPIRGVVNSALELRNKDFSRLTVDEVLDTFYAKIQGNICLYETVKELGLQLDFFAMLSSLISMSHAATQSSYAAANCFMDEYARFLRKQGIPGTSIALGVIGDAGFMSRHSHNMMHLMRNGHYTTLGVELMEMFAAALFTPEPEGAWGLGNPVALGTEPTKLRQLIDAGNVPVPLWERDARWRIIGTHAMRQGNKGGRGAGGAGSAGQAKDMIVERLAKLLWLPVEKLKPDSSLAALGIDSMIASEFRHWIYQTFKKNLSMMELLAQDMTSEKLATIIEE